MSGLSTTQAGKVAPDYELTVIYAPENARYAQNNAVNMADLVTKTVMKAVDAGFTVSSMEVDKVKTLAYPINSKFGTKEEQGLFAYFDLCGLGNVSKLSDALDTEVQVLRYLLVRSRNSLLKSKEYK